VSPSVVTRRLLRLEQRYQLPLVWRDSRTVVLTSEGREFLPIAQDFLRQLQATDRELARIAKSTLARPKLLVPARPGSFES